MATQTVEITREALWAVWTAHLKSGAWDKGTNVLKRKLHDGTCSHCCLGVLCELIDPEGLDVSLDRSVSGDETAGCSPAGLSFSNVQTAGLVNGLGVMTTEAPFVSLAQMNDSGSRSHKEIGQLIDEHPEWVFTDRYKDLASTTVTIQVNPEIWAKARDKMKEIPDEIIESQTDPDARKLLGADNLR